MKLAKLSLAAIVVAGLATSTFAASDTLADAFKNGKVNGELRAWYFDRDVDNAPAKTGSIFNSGVMLGYVTDAFYGLTFGATVQSNYAPFADTEAKTAFKGDLYGSGAVLSEAYLAYNISKTTLKVGRQFISSPLVSGSGSRMIKESFEGALLINTDLPATTLIAGYVSKFQGRTTGAFGASADDSDIPEFTKTGIFPGTPSAVSAVGLYFDGAYTAAVINSSITNLTLIGQYAVVNDVADAADVDVYHLEGNYVIPMSGFKLGLDAVYRASKTGTALDVHNLEGNYMAGRVSAKGLAGFDLSFAYGSSDKSDDLIAGMGNGADNLYTGTVIRGGSNTYAKDTDSYLFAAKYDFSKIGVAGLSALAQYAVAEQDVTDTDYKTIHASVAYAIPALKGLSVALQYETQDKDVGSAATVTTDEYRFMANYKF